MAIFVAILALLATSAVTDVHSEACNAADDREATILLQHAVVEVINKESMDNSIVSETVAELHEHWGVGVIGLVVLVAIACGCHMKVLHKHNDFHGHKDHDAEDLHDHPVQNTMTYHVGWLRSWTTFAYLKNTIWHNTHLWMQMLQLGIITVIIAVMTWTFLPSFSDPKGKLAQIGTMLNIFVAMMLGFFLSSTVSTWMDCVSSFYDLFNSIRNLAMQLRTLGAPEEQVQLIQRYCLVSTRFLTVDISSNTMPPRLKADTVKAVLDELEGCAGQKPMCHLKKVERDNLEQVRDIAGQIWFWNASIIGRMAQDGDIPAMATPTFGGLMTLCQTAQSSIKQVKHCMVNQMPFSYTHTLCTLVHITNLAFAISLGLTLGGFLNVTGGGKKDVKNHMADIVVATLRCTISPLLYQTFLELGLHLSTPSFGGAHAAHAAAKHSEDDAGDAHMPISQMTASLVQDLTDAALLANNPPLWAKPCFGAKK